MERVQDSSLLPVNVERKVTLVGQHLNLFQVMESSRAQPAEQYNKAVFMQVTLKIYLNMNVPRWDLFHVIISKKVLKSFQQQ